MKSAIIKIRPFKPSDTDDIVTYASQRELSRYTTLPRPYTKKDAQFFINLTKKNLKKKSSYEFGIELREEEKVVGGVGLIKVDHDNKHAELGYVLSKHYWRRGIMSEALTLILNFAFKDLKLNRVYARVFHPNIPSAKLLEKLGFKHEGTLRKATKHRGKWMDEHIYSILKDEWKKK